MKNKILSIIKMIRITYSSNYSMRVADNYWQNTDITHTSMDESQFDFYYQKIIEIMKPSKNEYILDYGGGNGEIAYRFKKDGFNIKHCDLSLQMVNNAISKYNLDSSICKELDKSTYHKILFHNAFFYIHPTLIESFLNEIYDKLKDDGCLYLTDTIDFDKRKYLGHGKIYMYLTKLFPVCQIQLAGFFVKNSQLEFLAKKIGFSIEKYDSWGNYRSHWILTKGNNDK